MGVAPKAMVGCLQLVIGSIFFVESKSYSAELEVFPLLIMMSVLTKMLFC
jgi:hypothetical protein